ncbi:MAG TPA: hypothetical protein VM578_11530 [Candidatus Saccharimonadales bacterium]|nr:hypothetical protein [Candidatus Saccharimonadales bacterium]
MSADKENRSDRFVWEPGDVQVDTPEGTEVLCDFEADGMPDAKKVDEDYPTRGEPTSNEAHFLHSTLRERIVEHVFVGDALRRLWQLGVTDVEVLRSEFDAGGYDLAMSRGKVTRHIQFKSVMTDGRTARTNISLKLMEKPSGCVIWIVVTPQLETQSYLWFGGLPGEPLPDISGLQVAKHAKGNAEGTKTERPNHRIVPRSRFVQLDGIDAVLRRLFGDLP